IADKFDVDRGGSQFGKPYANGLRLYLGMALHYVPDFGENEAHMICRRIWVQSQYRLEQHLIAAAQVFDIDGSHRAVRNGKERPFFGAHASGTEADVFDGARAVSEAANVAHANHFVAQNR